MGRRGWMVAAAGLLLLPAAAETPRIRHARLGIGMQFRDRAWNQLEVEIENPGEERSALLVYEHTGRVSGQRLVRRQPLLLQGRSLARYRIPVFMDIGTGGMQDLLQAGAVRLTDGARIEWARFDVLARPTNPSRIHFLSASDPFVSFNFLREMVVQERSTGCARTALRSRDLPRDTLALRPFDILVLGDEGETPLDALQREALGRWIEQGGVLVFTPGPGATPASLRSWAPLLPARYGRGLVTDRIPELETYGEEPFLPADGMLLRRLLVHNGRLLLGTENNPLAAVRDIGNGRVVALAFDAAAPAFQEWPGASRFWSALMPWPSPLQRYALEMTEPGRELQELTAHLAGVKVMDRASLHRYLLAVTGLLGVLLLGARWTRRPEWGWAAAAGCAAVIGTAAMLRASAAKEEMPAFINEIAMVRAGRSGAPGAQAAVSVFSPRDQVFRLEPDRPDLALHPGPSDTRPPEWLMLDEARPPRVDALRVRAHGVRHLLAEGLLPHADLPEAEVRVTARGVRCRVRNSTGDTLEDGFVRWHRLVAPLGNTEPGSETEETVRSLRAPAGLVYSQRAVRQPLDEWRDRLRDLFFMEGTAREAGFSAVGRTVPPLPLTGEWEEPSLYYWGRRAVLPLAYEPAADRRAIVLWALPVHVAYDRGDLLLPKGVLRMEPRHRPGIRHVPPSRFQGQFDETIQIAFTLPDDCPDLEVTGLRLFADFEGPGYRTRLGLVPAGADDPEAMVPAGGRGAIRDIEEPARYFDSTARRILLVAQIEKLPDAEGPALTPHLRNQWYFRELDIELTGTTR